MYMGYRDVPLSFEIEQDFCSLRHTRSGDFVEILIPDREFPREVWKSFMVMPWQVYYKNFYMNEVIGINANSRIMICCHTESDEGKRLIRADTIEHVDPYVIIMQINKYHIYPLA